jgi:dTDP-4-amino-4,6-dideoxygalactose transaminase
MSTWADGPSGIRTSGVSSFWNSGFSGSLTEAAASTHRWDILFHLASRGNLTLPVLEPSVQSCYHILAILVSPDRRDNLREALLARGIETAPHYTSLHSSPFWVQAFGTHQRPLPVTERVGRSLLRLPIYPALTSSQQELVIEALYDLLQR